jgi:hypothetical protein
LNFVWHENKRISKEIKTNEYYANTPLNKRWGKERNKLVVPLIQLAFFFVFSKERKISKF